MPKPSASRLPNDPRDTPCVCGSTTPAKECCLPYLEGTALAPTAEKLMRSRYLAYTLANVPYLLSTWHASTRPVDLKLDDEPLLRWLGLSIKHHQSTGSSAIVEFIARYKIDSRAYRLHETSRFVQENGQWLYVDGDIHD